MCACALLGVYWIYEEMKGAISICVTFEGQKLGDWVTGRENY